MVRITVRLTLIALAILQAGTALAQEPTPTPQPTATPGRLRNFSLEGYFEPLPIATPDPSAQALFSPMDLRLIARSAITFWNMINFGGWLSWVGAFAVAGMAIIGLIRVIFFREGL